MIARFLRWLFGPSCDECDAYIGPSSLHGNHHRDWCSRARHWPAEGSGRE